MDEDVPKEGAAKQAEDRSTTETHPREADSAGGVPDRRTAGGGGDDDLRGERDDHDDGGGSPDLSHLLPPVARTWPRVTAEVERLEAARLSDAERARAHADLYGLPPPGTAYRDRLVAEKAADAVEAALVEIPPVDRVALLRAQIASPFVVSSPSRVLPFLEAEDGDPRRAARRIVRYWEGRERLLGDEAFSPEALGADRNPHTDEDRGRLYRRGFRPTGDPKVDEALRRAVVKNSARWLAEKIDAVDREIDALPPAKKAALLDVKQRRTDAIDEEHYILFLECEEYDPARAAKRMANYWDVKCYLFGEEDALDGDEDLEAFAQECREEIDRGIVYNLPGSDAYGRGLVMICVDKCPTTEASQKRLLKVIWFCIKQAMADFRTRRNGLVYVCHSGNNSQMKTMSLEFVSRVIQLNFHSSPLRVCAFHRCSPPRGWIYHAVFLPFFKWLMMRSGRMRFILHDGETGELLATLEGFGMRREQLPAVLGGSLNEEEYVREWVQEWLLVDRK